MNTYTYGQYPSITAATVSSGTVSQSHGDGAPIAHDQVAEYAFQLLGVRIRVITGTLLGALSTVCRYLGYTGALVFAGDHYANYYHLTRTYLPTQHLRYYANKLEYTSSDSIYYYRTGVVESYMQNIKSSLKTSGVIFAATVGFWMAGKFLRRASRAILKKPSHKM
ncbi:hypothetical protein F-S17_0376 [Faustovirus]|nr:hypothetical protein F-S17_0376 [Faustovirus]